MRLRSLVATLLVPTLAACSTSHRADPGATLQASVLLAPSIRRLSVPELESAAQAVVGTKPAWSRLLPPDARQNDFSRSLTQSVDALLLTQLYDAAANAAETLDLSSLAFPGCAAAAATTDDACAEKVVSALATRAFRRAPSASERGKLRALFDLAAGPGTFRDGVVLVVRALLGSPKVLYETALGDDGGVDAGERLLSDGELASQLAWLVSGAPPDDELLAVAAGGELRSGVARVAQARRLLGKSESRYLYRRFVEEWLGLEKLSGLAKSNRVLAEFPELRDSMLQETDAVIDDVLSKENGSLELLFAGGFSIVPPQLAPLYGIETPKPDQRLSLTRLGRVGLLQGASFLATFAHEDESAPVLRGKAVLERLLCRRLPKPAELGINVVLPAPDANATTRERFGQHSVDPLCRQCHETIDGVGYTFENFDAVGRLRELDSGKAVDSSGHVTLDGQEMVLADSAELSRALAKSRELSECAARHVVRFAAGEEAPAVEDDFIATTRLLPAETRGSVLELVLTYVQGDWFAKRQSR